MGWVVLSSYLAKPGLTLNAAVLLPSGQMILLLAVKGNSIYVKLLFSNC